MRIIAVISARNEGENLYDAVYSLFRQSQYISRIIVVNDGLTEEVERILWNIGCYVINAPAHKESYLGKPELAKVWNIGLKEAAWYYPDYILLLGADHPLPPSYVEDLLKELKKDPSIVIASGRISGEGFKKTQPRGSGRLVLSDFWEVLNDTQYPLSYGWESWLIYSAMDVDLKAVCFENIDAGSGVRRTSLSSSKAESLGKGMYALGYYWIYALGRSAKTFLKSPKAGISMLKGWLSRKNVERLEVANYVKAMQKKRIIEKLMLPICIILAILPAILFTYFTMIRAL